MPDKQIECLDCGQSFVFTEGEQEFFTEKGYTPPKRCPGCRAKKRARLESGGGGGGGGRGERRRRE